MTRSKQLLFPMFVLCLVLSLMAHAQSMINYSSVQSVDGGLVPQNDGGGFIPVGSGYRIVLVAPAGCLIADGGSLVGYVFSSASSTWVREPALDLPVYVPGGNTLLSQNSVVLKEVSRSALPQQGRIFYSLQGVSTVLQLDATQTCTSVSLTIYAEGMNQ